MRVYIEIVQFIYALFPPSPSYFFSLLLVQIWTFFALCPNKSRAEPRFWHCVWHWKYIRGLVYAQGALFHVAFVHQTLRSDEVKIKVGDLWAGTHNKQALDALWRNISIKVIDEKNNNLNCTRPSKQKLWSRHLDLTVKNEMSFVFYYIDFFSFLPQKQIRSQWQVW